MKTDLNGTSTCPPGQEHFESFRSLASGRMMYQYDYRTPDGRLFSTVAPDLEICRNRRDVWIEK